MPPGILDPSYQQQIADAVAHHVAQLRCHIEMCSAVFERPSVLYKPAPKLITTGEKPIWFVTFGDVYGSGTSPNEAMHDFDINWRKKL